MFIGFITDCADADAALRLRLQGNVLFGGTPFLSQARCEIEAAGLLIDALDVTAGSKGIIFVNVAPRNGEAKKKWDNGVPFGYFRVRKTLVVTTIGPETLSLVAKLGLATRVNVMDISRVMSWGVEQNLISKIEADEVRRTQFRSLFFAPRSGKWIWASDRSTIPASDESIDALVAGVQGKHFVWFVDCFGNVKTTLLSSEFESLRSSGKHRRGILRYKALPRLSDVPDDGKPAWVVGSSGYGTNRFMELVVQGGSAAKKLRLKVGMPIQV